MERAIVIFTPYNPPDMPSILTSFGQRLSATLPRDTPARLARWLMIVLALVLLAVWINRLLAPRPVGLLPDTRAVAAPIRGDAILWVFGIDGSQTTTMSNVTLTGVFAGPGGTGFATFRVPKGQVAVLSGGEVVDGITLARVDKDHVVLNTPDGERRVPLTKEKATLPVAGGVDR